MVDEGAKILAAKVSLGVMSDYLNHTMELKRETFDIAEQQRDANRMAATEMERLTQTVSRVYTDQPPDQPLPPHVSLPSKAHVSGALKQKDRDVAVLIKWVSAQQAQAQPQVICLLVSTYFWTTE